MTFEMWLVATGCALLVLAGLVSWWLVIRRGLPSLPRKKIETQTIEVDGWTIRYLQTGRGPHLVLLHGLGANLLCWRWILNHLKPHFTVTALDLPGFGQSSKPTTEKYGLDEQTERLEKILRKLGIEDSYIVGNSMGGNIALWFALRFPFRVRALCVIAPATSPKLVPLNLDPWTWVAKPVSWALNRHAIKLVHKRTVSKRELVDDERIAETLQTYVGKGDAVRSFMLGTSLIRDARLSKALKDVTQPLLILWGSQDKLVNRKIIDALESALPKAESHVHIGGGHHLQEDEPEWVAEKITSFFLGEKSGNHL